MPKRRSSSYESSNKSASIKKSVLSKQGSATFKEIHDYVEKTVTLRGKTPRNSMHSVLHRMCDDQFVEKDGSTYRLLSVR
jgi:hypothetical protein